MKSFLGTLLDLISFLLCLSLSFFTVWFLAMDIVQHYFDIFVKYKQFPERPQTYSGDGYAMITGFFVGPIIGIVISIIICRLFYKLSPKKRFCFLLAQSTIATVIVYFSLKAF